MLEGAGEVFGGERCNLDFWALGIPPAARFRAGFFPRLQLFREQRVCLALTGVPSPRGCSVALPSQDFGVVWLGRFWGIHAVRL